MNRIKVDLDRTLGPIDRNLFGGFVEHLGRCVYGGIFDPFSPLTDPNGLRSDVRAAIVRLRMSVVRYPGGNFVSGYRWRDGVGPLADRPIRADLAWGAVDPNTFGTNEFMRFCRTLDLAPYLVVNCGDGDLREARDWVEYCNGVADTALTRLRAAHGHPESHRVRYWGVGNEVDGAWQIGAKSAAEYAGPTASSPRSCAGPTRGSSSSHRPPRTGTVTSSSGPRPWWKGPASSST